MKTVFKRIVYDDILDNYAGFLDYKWANQLGDLTQGSKLDSHVLNLILDWKAISCVHRWPWLLMHGVKDLREAGSSRLKTATEVSVQQIWEMYQSEPEFNIGLWMSEIIAFGGVYFAYETFLINSVKQATGLSSLRTNRLPTEIQKLLGQEIRNACWTDSSVERARRIRHALVHNGRMITPELEKYRSDLILEGNEIAIRARDTTALFVDLKRRASVFSEGAMRSPSFRNPDEPGKRSSAG